MTQPTLNAEGIATPDISDLVIEDDTPVDNFQSEKQQRLLVEPLYSAQALPEPFIAAANVGVFFAVKQEPLVPDVFVSPGVQMPADWSQKRNRSYFVWEFGKVPEVVIEIVSNRVGNELTTKKDAYAKMGVTYYAVFDPLKQIQEPDQMDGRPLDTFALFVGLYGRLERPWFETLGLGLTLWEGTFEGHQGTWLRWCDGQNQVIPTGAERAEQEKQRADAASARAERLAARLREMGIEVDED
ncbi:MAG: Uma2 family endonuclease [Cyanobacteria bacterium P01_C01_bin.73]